MSAPHDTREAVERKAAILESMAAVSFGEGSAGRDILNEAAAMLRRLHARAVEAERERDGAIREIGNTARLVTTTARNAALREAAALIECGCRHRNEVVMQRPNSAARWNLCEHPNCMAIEVAAILTLISKEPRHD